MEKKTRLLLIDGHSMAFRAFYALPADSFATATGQHTNAVHGFLSMLLRLLGSQAPTHVAVAFDAGSHTFRTDEYPEYKAGRAETPEAFFGQIPLIQDMLDALGITQLERENFEADDILATLARTGAEAGMEVLVVSGDRDTFQLVGEQVTVLYPIRGVSELARMTPSAVAAKFGVPPNQYPELAALTGEKADNLPGVPGVGEKTAAKWLHQFGSLDQLIAQAGEVTGKVGANLRANLENVVRNRRLNRLVDSMELGLSVGDLGVSGGDRAKVRELCDALEFNTLRERLLALIAPQEAPVPEVERTVRADVASWLANLTGPVALDVVSSGGVVELISLATHTECGSVQPEDFELLEGWLPTAPTVVHNSKAAWHQLQNVGIDLAGTIFDTELASYLCFPGQRTYELPEMLARLLRREVGNTPTGAQGMFDFGDGVSNSQERACGVYDLAQLLDRELKDRGAHELLLNVEMPVQRSLAAMESVGIAVDEAFLGDLERELSDRVTKAADASYQAVGHELNLSSPKQLQEVLFEELGMPKTKRTKTGYTTDAEALAELFAATAHPFLEHLLVHREQIKLRQIVETLRKSVHDDGRIHTTFQQTVAATGRLSSLDPNLQNIPARTDEGLRIREAFVVGEGFETLLTADYSQIEMRIMAHLSGDEELIAAFQAGEDLHRYVAARVFGVGTDEVTTPMRGKIKAMSYGLVYGLSAYGLSRQLGIEVGEARDLMEEYFERFGGVKRYLDSVVAQARSTGYTETILGRRRYLPELTSDNRQRREMAERIALNAPIQGSAADVIKVAMVRLDEALARGNMKSRMLLQVHDELVLEVASGELEEATLLVRAAMGGAASLRVPLDVSVGVGPNWRAAAH